MPDPNATPAPKGSSTAKKSAKAVLVVFGAIFVLGAIGAALDKHKKGTESVATPSVTAPAQVPTAPRPTPPVPAYQPSPLHKSVAGFKDIPLLAGAKYSTETTANGTAHRWSAPGKDVTYNVSLLDVGNEGTPDRGVISTRFSIDQKGIMASAFLSLAIISNASGQQLDGKEFVATYMKAISNPQTQRYGDVECVFIVSKTDDEHATMTVTMNGGM